MDISQPGPLRNATLDLIARRRSTRTYDDAPITPEEKQAVLHAALRAPTGGNMVLYSIIEIEDPALEERLSHTCDEQPFIARAPWVLVFVADWQKWTDLFEACDAYDMPDVAHRRQAGTGDLLLACCDALIAAQTAVIAAESLGIGSCYIGDVLENGETHAELLGLPPHTLPIAMLCFGRPRKAQEPIGRYGTRVLHTDRYARMTAAELSDAAGDLALLHAPNGLPDGADNYPQAVYRRKFASDFMHEMNRSADWWIDRWRRG
jgi:FMN reductase (NADPH)/FMN reductase [NAD(P)H]